jgi:hypothetical protein
MKFRIFCACLALCAISTVGVANQARANVIDIVWKKDGASQRFTNEATVAEKKVVEMCGKLKKGDVIRWKFVASGPLDFNIHYHEGKNVEFLVKTDGALSGGNQLVAPVDQDYCWMWTNPGAKEATITIDLSR